MRSDWLWTNSSQQQYRFYVELYWDWFWRNEMNKDELVSTGEYRCYSRCASTMLWLVF